MNRYQITATLSAPGHDDVSEGDIFECESHDEALSIAMYLAVGCTLSTGIAPIVRVELLPDRAAMN